MRNPSQVDELTEILVHRDENPVLRTRSFQQCSIARVRAEGMRFHNVVSIAAQPLCQSPPSASISKESHRPLTDTGASVSPAITVWA